MLQTILQYLVFVSHKGMISTPKAIDLPKQQIRHEYLL
jgi:hypothetical protein